MKVWFSCKLDLSKISNTSEKGQSKQNTFADLSLDNSNSKFGIGNSRRMMKRCTWRRYNLNINLDWPRFGKITEAENNFEILLDHFEIYGNFVHWLRLLQ